METLKVLSFLLFAVCILGNPVKEVESNEEQNVKETEVEETDGSGDETELLQKREEITNLPNIGFMFQGYNLLKGNPMDPRGSDPGFTRFNIFQAEYTENKKTYDGRYKMPDHTDATREQSCTMTASAETMHTQKQYKDSLTVKASVSASGGTAIWQASFSASTEYNRVSETLQSNEKSIIKSEATCTVYGAALHNNPPPKFSDNFFNNLKALGDPEPDYASFLDRFGTHFPERVVMGSRYSKVQTMTKANEEKLQKEGIDVDVTASASLVGKVDVEVSTSVSKQKEAMEKFSSSVEETKEISFGSKPPSDGDPKTWMASAFAEPYPVHYQLRSILELFKLEYFKDTPEVKYKEIKAGLETFLRGYCKKFANLHPKLNAECEGPRTGCGGGSICSANAICEELPAGRASDHEEQQYTCKCKAGFKGDGTRCDRVPKWIAKETIGHVDTRGKWGTWGGMQYCPNGIFAHGFQMKAEKPIDGDDTGANAVCLLCKDESICSKRGTWGTWSVEYKCEPGSYLYGWRQNVEKPIDGDDTALNNVEYKCKDMESGEVKNTLKGNAQEWGDWSRFKGCPENQLICGINTRVEDPDGDDTALNDIEHKCCQRDLSKKKANKKKHHKGKKNKNNE